MVKISKTAAQAKTDKLAPDTEPKPYHHGKLRESLLEAADTVLAREGALGITLREVATEAGVSHAAPYHHFASLDEMLAAVACETTSSPAAPSSKSVLRSTTSSS